MYKSKYPKLIEHFNDEHGLLLFDNEQKEIDSIIDNYLKEQLTLPDVVKSFYCWNSKCDGKKCKNQCMGCEYYEEKELKQ